jgi:hypothetical protein
MSTQRPDSNKRDPALVLVCKIWRRLIRKAFDNCRPEVVGRPALELIERRETGAESNEKPFYAGQKVKTIKHYSNQLISVFSYVWRTCDDDHRRPYRLSTKQTSLIDRIRHVAGNDSLHQKDRLGTLCLQFWIALLDQALPDDEYQSALLSGVAVLGLKPDCRGGGWAPPHEFSPILSALITTSKALVLHCAYCEREDMLLKDSDTAPPVYELVKDMSERFMRLSDYSGRACPMNRMLRLRTLARTLAKQRNTPGLVSWEGDKLLVDRQSFSLSDLRSMVKGLYETARLELFADVLLLSVDEGGFVHTGATALPELCLADLEDQPQEQGAGFSFLKHPQNPFGQWEDWLIHRVVTEKTLTDRFFGGSRGVEWRESAVAAYMQKVRKFKESLFTLVHLTGGAPARGTEITSIQYENDTSGTGYRGVFVEGGLVSFTTSYHKGYRFSKQVKNVHRYVPREVGELVVYFLGLALPFINDVQHIHNGVAQRTPFIWEPVPEEEWEVGSESDASGHGSGSEADVIEVAQSANPDGFWSTDRIRRVLREYTFKYMGARLGPRPWRHSYPAIQRELCRDREAAEWLNTLYFNTESPVDDARALQSGHSLQTEETNYGRSVAESPFQTMAERARFRRVSVDWHRILQFPSTWEGTRTDAPMVAEQEKHANFRLSTLSTVDLRTAFRKLTLQPDAEFRSVQEDGLRAIV